MNFCIVSCMCYDLMKKVCFLILYHHSMLFICDVIMYLFVVWRLGGEVLSIAMDIGLSVVNAWVGTSKVLFVFL